VKTPSEPSTPPGFKEETATAVPPPAGKPKKKSKDKTQTAEANVTSAIQPAGPTEDGSRTLTRALGLKIGRIVIDPGHGGHDTGTLGPTGLEEKEVVLDVGLKLRKLLEQNTGCEVVMTRSDDTFIPLEERTAIANQKSADLFISVHANASSDKSARGIETYYLNFTSSPDALEVAARENASSQEAVHQLQDLIKKIAMTEKVEESQDFASQVQREVYNHVTKASGAQRDRGIKKAPFVVLIGANMPSVLAEISFLTNPKDEHLLRRPDYREKIAEALYEGILDYLKTLGEVKGVQRVAADQTSAAARPN
jgi:N-acetylmuramoyl-L-alanine amidase